MKYVFLTLMLMAAFLNIQAATAFAITGSFDIPDYTLPVELSSFTASFTIDYQVKINWTSQSESNLLGYYIYRGETDNLATARQVSGLIEAHNTSTTQAYSFSDTEELTHHVYFYWLNAYEMNGISNYHGPVSVLTNTNPNITPPSILQTGIQNVYPNPFNPQTTIAYSIKSAAKVHFEFYNLKGQKVYAAQKNHNAAGFYSLTFDGCDDSKNELPSGIYFVVMKAGTQVSSRKLILMK